MKNPNVHQNPVSEPPPTLEDLWIEMEEKAKVTVGFGTCIFYMRRTQFLEDNKRWAIIGMAPRGWHHIPIFFAEPAPSQYQALEAAIRDLGEFMSLKTAGEQK